MFLYFAQILNIMTKQELVSKIVKDTSYAKWEVNIILASLKKHVYEAFKNEEEIVIQGFGSYHVKTKPTRFCINPRTKKRIMVPEKKSVVFTVTPKLQIGKTCK